MTVWTTQTDSTAAWDSIPPTLLLLLTEAGDRLRTESDVALVVDWSGPTWTTQTDSATTWTVVSGIE